MSRMTLGEGDKEGGDGEEGDSSGDEDRAGRSDDTLLVEEPRTTGPEVAES